MNKLVIELGGKERTLKFNMLFLEEYAKKLKENANNVSNTALMIYAAIKANSEVTETPMDCSFEDCFDWAEEMLLNDDVTKINIILEAYQQSNVYKSTIKKKMETESQQTGMELEDTLLEK
jgi:hypothetical protein